jgi:hypothetical protein
VTPPWPTARKTTGSCPTATRPPAAFARAPARCCSAPALAAAGPLGARRRGTHTRRRRQTRALMRAEHGSNKIAPTYALGVRSTTPCRSASRASGPWRWPPGHLQAAPSLRHASRTTRRLSWKARMQDRPHNASCARTRARRQLLHQTCHDERIWSRTGRHEPTVCRLREANPLKLISSF